MHNAEFYENEGGDVILEHMRYFFRRYCDTCDRFGLLPIHLKSFHNKWPLSLASTLLQEIAVLLETSKSLQVKKSTSFRLLLLCMCVLLLIIVYEQDMVILITIAIRWNGAEWNWNIPAICFIELSQSTPLAKQFDSASKWGIHEIHFHRLLTVCVNYYSTIHARTTGAITYRITI